jgi:hypothetical protein
MISPFPLSLPEIALAGSMAGAANAILASPGTIFSTVLFNHSSNEYSGDVQSAYARAVRGQVR